MFQKDNKKPVQTIIQKDNSMPSTSGIRSRPLPSASSSSSHQNVENALPIEENPELKVKIEDDIYDTNAFERATQLRLDEEIHEPSTSGIKIKFLPSESSLPCPFLYVDMTDNNPMNANREVPDEEKRISGRSLIQDLPQPSTSGIMRSRPQFIPTRRTNDLSASSSSLSSSTASRSSSYVDVENNAPVDVNHEEPEERMDVQAQSDSAQSGFAQNDPVQRLKQIWLEHNYFQRRLAIIRNRRTPKRLAFLIAKYKINKMFTPRRYRRNSE